MMNFWDQVRMGDGCWEWQRGRQPRGYGRLTFRGRQELAHRAAWELAYGSIPTGMIVCHHCDNPPCCNPAHLFLGTHKDNADDRDAKGRGRNNVEMTRGERNGFSKLSPADVMEIRCRAALGESQTAIGKDFSIHRKYVSEIKRGTSWGHIPLIDDQPEPDGPAAQRAA